MTGLELLFDFVARDSGTEEEGEMEHVASVWEVGSGERKEKDTHREYE